MGGRRTRQYSAGMRSLLRGLQWPASCDVCGHWPSAPVCANCRNAHAPLQSRCPSCALRLAPGLTRCHRCQTEPPPAWRTVHARVDYGYPWSGLVQGLKFQRQTGWAAPLAELMLECPDALTTLGRVDVVAPIPLTPARLVTRGYNQAWELVRALRRRTDLPPAWPDLLSRDGSTAAVHTLPRQARHDATRHAFTVTEHHAHRMHGAHVLLVDDVMTTGATLAAATRAVLEAGAASVSGWVFARTPPAQGIEQGME